MLLRIAQADATAMAAEFIKPSMPNYAEHMAEILQFDHFVRHPRHHGVKLGQYTDDTQMSIGVAEVLLKGKPYNAPSFADSWVYCFHRDPRDGYSRSFQKFLETTHSGAEFLNNIQPTSTKNGAAMRAMPIGFISDPQEVLAATTLQAEITHNSDEGVFAAQVAALLAHFAIHTDFSFESMFEVHLPPLLFNPEWLNCPQDEIKGIARKTIKAVQNALLTCNSLMSMLEQIIINGGDTDSIAAITWGIAAARFPNEELPQFMEHCLEPGGQYGVQFLIDLGTQLNNKCQEGLL